MYASWREEAGDFIAAARTGAPSEGNCGLGGGGCSIEVFQGEEG